MTSLRTRKIKLLQRYQSRIYSSVSHLESTAYIRTLFTYKHMLVCIYIYIYACWYIQTTSTNKLNIMHIKRSIINANTSLQIQIRHSLPHIYKKAYIYIYAYRHTSKSCVQEYTHESRFTYTGLVH